MAVKRGICSHCGKAIKLDDAYKASRCPFCGNRVETWAALKLAAADAPSGASARQIAPASHAPQGQGTAPVGPDMRKGECPHCGKNLMVDARSETMMCPACRNKFKTAAAIRLASSGAPSAPSRPAANGTSAPAGSSAALAAAGAEAYGEGTAVGARQAGSSSTATNPVSFYEQHKKAIWIGIAVVAVIVLVIVLATVPGAPEREIIGKYYLPKDYNFSLGTQLYSDSFVEIEKNTAKIHMHGIYASVPINFTLDFESWEITREVDGVYYIRFNSGGGNYLEGIYNNGYLEVERIPFVKQ